MNLAIIKTRSIVGIQARAVNVEIHLSNGLPAFSIVGLAQAAVKESKDRVRSAILNSNFDFPYRRITVNLAPADLPKVGCGFDLPIAIGILAASGQIPKHLLQDYEFIGELALDGSLRGVNSIIPAAIAVRKDKKSLIIPKENIEEAALVRYESIYSSPNLYLICNYLREEIKLEKLPQTSTCVTSSANKDWTDIKGQAHAKLAMQIAACGGHSILLNGPPGSGKTMLAERFNSLLPELSDEEALDCMAIKAIAGKSTNFKQWKLPPFRAPHHTASPAALVGGGNPPKPGEISLAHNGVLFLDELPEFSRSVLETLREPLESGNICIARAAAQIEFPANFQLITAMNPCPCGQFGNPNGECICSPEKVNRYAGKLSGPFLDRIDMTVNLMPLSYEELLDTQPSSHSSSEVRKLVTIARSIQLERQGVLNANLPSKECEVVCKLSDIEIQYLKSILKVLRLSARSIVRLLKVARTIADINNASNVCKRDLEQALSFKHNIKT